MPLNTEKTLGKRVAVYGATGHTGLFVVEELLRRGFVPIAIARSEEALTSARFSDPKVIRRRATVDDAESLDRALAGAAAVINCAGAFLDTASAVAAAAMRAGIHYLDVTAEQPNALATLDDFDAPARKAGVAVIPAMGFYGGFADLLATVAVGEWDDVDGIEVLIGLDSWHPPRGTRLTGERNTARRLVVENGQLVPVNLPPAEKVWSFAEPVGRQATLEIPFSEVILISSHLKPSSLHTHLSANALRDVRDAATPAPVVDATGRSTQHFVVEVVATAGGRTRRVIAKGRDIYAFSAPLICEVAERLLRPDFAHAGAHAPGAILDAHDVLSALRPDHLTFEVFND
ncbi:NAD(P)H-binding protein [Nordella sp. HKS 07]|uniref:saccharopine dehydrogenase NADP-binding domain-containing protein n=1 Tax=Nordella sp. HKS 07 TaxID=2712222 RepID=UPI0013E1FD16|nr:saccharopine dehydrogenase NADP-binding domain-containing protein [Nordella sp. HKS 07]QIG50458.1 NAD(P)H-binding protein [Nordella sp. HKS 07]